MGNKNDTIKSKWKKGKSLWPHFSSLSFCLSLSILSASLYFSSCLFLSVFSSFLILLFCLPVLLFYSLSFVKHYFFHHILCFSISFFTFLKFLSLSLSVVYFCQYLGTAHSECWLKYVFKSFLCKKAEKGRKARKLRQNLAKNGVLSCTQMLVEGKKVEKAYLKKPWSVQHPSAGGNI